MKIAVYTCMKNEEENITEWLDNVSPADVAVILDTGSTDQTAFLAKFPDGGIETPKTVLVAHGFISPFRFDVAFNTALALLPPDVDICIQLSADERLSGGWRETLERSVPYNSMLKCADRHEWRRQGIAHAPDTTKFHYDYDFGEGLVFRQDRIHSRTGYVWRYPFHEGLCAVAGAIESHVFVEGLRVTQKQNKSVNRMARDLQLAEQAIAEWPDDPRMVFYVGRQYMYAGQFRRALSYLERYPAMARKKNYEHALELQWCAEATAQCWQAIQAGGK